MLSETLTSATYLEALSIGLLYGTIFCTSECLPYLASYIAGTGAGFRKGLLITILYDAGRLISYTLIGVLVGLIGESVTSLLEGPTLASFRTYSSYAIGLVTILVGVHIFLKSRKSNYNCAKECNNFDEWKIRKYDFRAFTLGFTRGLIICPPLFALLVYSVPFGTPLDSIAIAFLFGFGTILSPMLLLGGITGWLLNKAPLFKKWISIIGSGALLVLGITTIILTVINSS